MNRRLDIGIILPVVALLTISFVLVLSASSYDAFKEIGVTLYYAIKHLQMIAVGIGFFLLGRFIPYRFFNKPIFFILISLIAIILSVLVLFIGETVLGGQRWIPIGDFRFMPVDISKAAIIYSMAFTLSRFKASKNRFIAMMIHLMVPVTLFLLTVLQPDFSSSLVLGGIAGVILFIAFEPTWMVVSLGLAAGAGLVIVARFADYRMDRINSFLASLKNIESALPQIQYGIYAVALGGLFGEGPGRSVFNKTYIAHAHNDMILSTLGEEYGFIGLIVLFSLYFILLLNLMRVAITTKDEFGKYFVIGVLAMIFVTMTINVFSTLGMIPPTGITLPLISFGGTNLVSTLGLLGLCLNIYYSQRKAS